MSAVSPDWLMQITNVCLSISGSLYLNSDAISTSTGIPVSLSNIGLTQTPTCIAVPQATINILVTSDRYSLVIFMSLKSHFLLGTILVPIVSLTALGCS